ncbi:MAG TPA: hypothetical protein VGE02_11710 [Gemmatimonadales bacterium]
MKKTKWNVVTVALALAGCDSGEGVPAAASASAGRAGSSAPRQREIVAIEVAALGDSMSAARMRDSLADAGWPVALVRQVRGDTLPPWRVRVSPAGDQELARMAGVRLASQGRQTRLAREIAAVEGPSVTVQPVNRGGRGAISRLRWTTAPGRHAFLAVESVTAIENEPAPDGFILAGEMGGRPLVVQRDSVWDVAPGPEWERVAYGRAFLIPTGGRDSVSIRRWGAVAGRTNLDISTIQRGAFNASSMNRLAGFAQPAVEVLHPDSVRDSQLMWQVTAPLPVAGGWRVRWSADGRTLAVGLPPGSASSPRVPRDDAPAAQWLAVDLRTHLVRGALPSHVQLASVSWVEGPTFDVSVDPPTSAPPIDVQGGVVETAGGWVVIRGQRTGGRRFVVGPGVALAATASGRFVLAVVPVVDPEEGAPRLRPVVYQIEVGDPSESAAGE